MDFRNGAAVQRSYLDFRVMRIDEMPLVETYIVRGADAPEGLGETAVPPIAPAVANAIFAASGKRIRKLPITSDSPQIKA